MQNRRVKQFSSAKKQNEVSKRRDICTTEDETRKREALAEKQDN